MSKVFELIDMEKTRQEYAIELIASENFVSKDIMKAVGSCLTNKYTEGYPAGDRTSGNKGRYYGGCQFYDMLEEYCCDKWREVFNTDYHVNVQPHSGSNANMAAYMSVLKPGDTILAMSLDQGGHLTHCSPVNFSGKLFKGVFYDLDESGRIDYDDLEKKIWEHEPRLVLAGASAYSRAIDYKKIREIIDKVAGEAWEKFGPFSPWSAAEYSRPYFMVDMAHVAGLIAAGNHPTPFDYADIITTTTHKTLRGPRGGMIFCRPELAKKVDSAVFPGTQGGPLQHIIAGKALCAEEALTDDYKSYIHQVVKNAKAMADEFTKMGYDVVTGGTDNHMFLLDLSKTHPGITGKMVQEACDNSGITLNKNCVPNEKRSSMQTSGVRIGTPAMTTKGYMEEDFIRVAHDIDEIIKGIEHEKYEELSIKVIDRRKAKEECYCNRCKKLIYKRSYIESEELPKNKLWTHYWEVTIGHNDWGNDSGDSIEHFDICSPDCLNKEMQLYVDRSSGNYAHNTEYIEIEHTSISCYEKGEENGN